MIIAIDGPSGSGKSTISKLIAQEMNLIYIDTGALYRTVAYGAEKESIPWDNGRKLGEYTKRIKITFKYENGINRVFLNNKDVTDKIRTPQISMGASKVSAHPEVRSALLDIQRDLGNSNNSILEGRDIGTVIFPNADLKIFLIASNEVRAERRLKELKEKGVDISFEEVLKQIILRDEQDSSRANAPLRKAFDAIEVDASNKTINQVVSSILAIIKGK